VAERGLTCPAGYALPTRAVVLANLPELRTFLQRLAAAPVSGQLTSWYRDPARNAACGGAAFSKHLRALAIDVRVAPAERLRAIVAFQNAGLRVIDEGDHLHVQLG
jgi:uncharacterized protein YcbK (DUF882 family)